MGMSNPLYSLLRDTSLELIRHRRLQELLPDILRRAQEFVEADVAYMALRDEASEVMRVAYYRGTIRPLPEDYAIRRGNGVSGQAWDTGHIVVAEDYPNYGHRLQEPYWSTMKSAMGVPLLVGGAVWGALILAHTSRPKTYSRLEVEGTEQLANFASLAIENARIIDSANAEIARRKEMETAMKRNEARYRTVLAESATAMCSADPETLRILECNRSFLQLFGYPLRTLLTMTLYDFVPYERSRVDRICCEALPKKKILPPIAITACRSSGEHVEVEFRMQLMRDYDRMIIFIMFRDLSEHRENKFLKVLQETSLDLLRRREGSEVLPSLLRRVMVLLSAPFGSVWLAEAGGNRIAPLLTFGPDALPELIPLRKGEGIAGKVWETGQPVVTADYPTWPHRLPHLASHLFGAAAGVPLKDPWGGIIGVIVLADKDPHREFDRLEVHYLEQMAQLASLALQAGEAGGGGFSSPGCPSA